MRSVSFAILAISFMSTDALAFGSGVDLNGLLVRPAIEVTNKRDDNVSRAETNAIASAILIVKPTLNVKNGSEIRNTVFDYALERGDYKSSKDDNYTDHFADLSYHNEPSAKLALDMGLAYVKTHDPRGANKAIATSAMPDQWHETSAYLNYGYGGITALGRLVFDVAASSKRYDNNLLLTEGRSLDIADSGLAFYYQFGAKTSALLEARYASYNYTLATSRLDSTEITYYTGVKWEASAKTTGTVKAGWQQKIFKDPLQQAKGFVSWDVIIGWSPVSYSTLDLGSSYKARESYGNTGFLKSNNLNLSWNHEWNSHFRHVVNIDYTINKDSNNQAWQEKVTNASLGVDYALNTWLDIALNYAKNQLISTAVNSSYTKNEVGVTFIAKL